MFPHYTWCFVCFESHRPHDTRTLQNLSVSSRNKKNHSKLLKGFSQLFPRKISMLQFRRLHRKGRQGSCFEKGWILWDWELLLWERAKRYPLRKGRNPSGSFNPCAPVQISTPQCATHQTPVEESNIKMAFRIRAEWEAWYQQGVAWFLWTGQVPLPLEESFLSESARASFPFTRACQHQTEHHW